MRAAGGGSGCAEQFGLREQLLSAGEAVFGDAFGKIEVADAEVCLNGVVIDGEGGVFGTVEAGAAWAE